MEPSGPAQCFRSQRKRKRISYSSDGLTESPAESKGLENLLSIADGCTKLVVFSGSGLSAGSGMSTFSTKGGLYERAQKRFNVSNGKRLFTYSFYEKRKLEALAFFADIYAEARKAKPGLGHRALAQVAGAHKLLRHYTMNIDGLAETAGMDIWHVDNNPTGLTVEMHGNINQLVCPSCGVVVMMTPALLRKLRSKKAVPCTKCDCQSIRCRIMLYDDAEDDVITPEDVFDIMEEDVQQADLIMWVGISFEQSASTAYFRRVRQYLMEGKRQDITRQAIINLSEDALWNLMSACSNTGSMDVLEVLGSSDAILPLLATAMTTSTTISASADTTYKPPQANLPLSGDGEPVSEEHTKGHEQSSSGQQTAALDKQRQGQQATASQQPVTHQQDSAQQSTMSHSVAMGQSGKALDGQTHGLSEQVPGHHQNAVEADSGRPQPTGFHQQPAGLQHPSSSAGTSRRGGQAPSSSEQGPSSAGQAPSLSEQGPMSAGQGPTSAGQAQGSPGETPIWLQPVAPLEDSLRHQATPTTMSFTDPHALPRVHQQQQRQEERHERAQATPAGTALHTMMPEHDSSGGIELAYGQVNAALGQPSGGLKSFVAPMGFHDNKAGQDEQGQGQDPHAQGQDAPGQGEDARGHGQDPHGWGQDTPNLVQNARGQGQDPQDQKEASQQTEQDTHAQDVQHAENIQSSLNGGLAVPQEQPQRAQHEQTNGACGGSGHSGVVNGECAVSSRENAQHHLQLAAPLPWQQPEESELGSPANSEI